MERPRQAGILVFSFGIFVCAAILASRGAGAAGIGPAEGGAVPQPLPLFPPTNWWNLDVSAAPVDPGSPAFIAFINNGGTRQLHPDFGGDVSPGSVEIYGMPYVVVDGTQPKDTVQFQYSDESDGVDHSTDTSCPFYPIPARRSLSRTGSKAARRATSTSATSATATC